jgi:outer membrane murein-binding lipoprotein Lpp
MNGTGEFLIGIAVQTVLFLAGCYAMILRNDWSAKTLKEQLDGMQDELKKLAEVITTQAVQTTRIDNINSQVATLQRELSDLRRGNGWITRPRGGVEGEYP